MGWQAVCGGCGRSWGPIAAYEFGCDHLELSCAGAGVEPTSGYVDAEVAGEPGEAVGVALHGPVGFQNPAMQPDRRFQAAASY